MDGLTEKAACPASYTHGNPFRYCGYCDWIEKSDTRLTEYRGLAHECTDPACHVLGFVTTLTRLDAE